VANIRQRNEPERSGCGWELEPGLALIISGGELTWGANELC
jgi:hypothetical protein